MSNTNNNSLLSTLRLIKDNNEVTKMDKVRTNPFTKSNVVSINKYRNN